MSSNEQCHFELALVKVRRIQNRWNGCVPGVAARQRVPAPREEGAGTDQPLRAPRTAGTGQQAGDKGCCHKYGPCILRRGGEEGVAG